MGEIFTFHPQMGVLMVCTWRMFSKLYDWLPVALTSGVGFGLALNVMAPNFALEGSPGEITPRLHQGRAEMSHVSLAAN